MGRVGTRKCDKDARHDEFRRGVQERRLPGGVLQGGNCKELRKVQGMSRRRRGDGQRKMRMTGNKGEGKSYVVEGEPRVRQVSGGSGNEGSRNLRRKEATETAGGRRPRVYKKEGRGT